ncbi:unnamed protein product [Gongylonema pulchrum]|uniref:Chitin-binding type-2 domain-containing protein n=1 Tax=Gongylonema pulchrum TaxID=637853 RepID=A0A183D2C6_9BILA|nr:unnamed protein product [Gongylonema pulchrum]
MIDPLAADPQSRSHFLQCQPAPNSLYCGRWQRMPCEPGLIFNVQLQVCVWDASAQPGGVPPPTAAPGVSPYQPLIPSATPGIVPQPSYIPSPMPGMAPQQPYIPSVTPVPGMLPQQPFVPSVTSGPGMPSQQPLVPAATPAPGMIPYQPVQPQYVTTMYPVPSVPTVQRPYDSTGQCSCSAGLQIGVCIDSQCPGQSVCQTSHKVLICNYDFFEECLRNPLDFQKKFRITV